MLRITQYVGPVLTFEMRVKTSEVGAINVCREIKLSKVKGKKMKFWTKETGPILLDVDNIKRIESITPISESEINDIIAGRK